MWPGDTNTNLNKYKNYTMAACTAYFKLLWEIQTAKIHSFTTAGNR